MIFDVAAANDVARLERFVNKFGNDVNERNEDGLTCLHICAAKGNFEGVCCLLQLGAQFGLQDFENGWTALHYSIYYNHPRISLMLIQYGAVLDQEVFHSKDAVFVVDKDGLTPLQLLSTVLTSNQKFNNHHIQPHGNIVSYGKSDIVLGVPLPKAINILRPKRLDSLLNENIIAISSAKYHNLVVCAEGKLWSFGHGKSGKLGHGDESSQPEPRLIHFPSPRIKITQVSAAETHSLALTDNGDVYSFGSDRFGQCGLGASTQGSSNTSSHRSAAGSIETHRMYTHPTRIEALRKEKVLGIAAGESHSLCFTSSNELFAWGSNNKGQLALRFTDTTAGNSGQQVNTPKKVKLSLSTTAASVASGSGGFGSLGSQTSSSKVMTIVQVIAGQNSSLSLTRSLANRQGNIGQDRHHGVRIGTLSEVYQWGDGVFQPRKIHFPRTSQTSRSRENSIINDDTYTSSFDALTIDHSQINMICAGRHHFLALSKAGSVYSWGLGADQLGHGIEAHTPSHLSVPMMIEALHPDRTKSGKIVFIAAAGNRSAAVTTLGEVFSWGTSNSTSSNNAHYRPVPQREQGIRRAVKVALTEDSTFVLASASIPELPILYPSAVNVKNVAVSDNHVKIRRRDNSEDSDEDEAEESNDTAEEEESQDTHNTMHASSRSVPSLQAICQTQLCKTVNMKNVLDALLFSEQHCSFILERYCLEFISLNLDALLVQLKPKNLDRIAVEWSLPSSSHRKPSWDHHNASSTAGASSKASNSMTRGISLKAPSLTSPSSPLGAMPSLGRRQSSGSSQKDAFSSSATATVSAVNGQGASRKNLEAIETVEEMQRLIRSTKKKLAAIDDIQGEQEKMLTPEQKEKVSKKAGLRLDLMKMEQMLVRLQQREQFNNDHKAAPAENDKRESVATAKQQKEQQQVKGKAAIALAAGGGVSNQLPSFDQWSAMLMTEEEQVRYLLQQTALEAAASPRPPPAASAIAIVPPSAKQQQQASQPEAAAWITINNKPTSPLSQQASPGNSTTLSSSTPNGRTVLSPPEPPLLPAKQQGQVQAQQQQARSMTKPNPPCLVSSSMQRMQAQQQPVQAAGQGEDIAATSLRATFETSCSLADFITPKKSGNAAKKMLKQQHEQLQPPLLGVSNSLVAATVSEEKNEAVNKPAIVSSPWGKTSAAAFTTASAASVPSSSSRNNKTMAVAGPSSFSSSSLISTPTKHKKLSDIVAEEERARENSNMTTLRGNDIPWLIERKPRAESFERLVAEQLCAKQDEDERILKEAALAAEKKQKKRERSKEKRKEQRTQQRQAMGKELSSNRK